MSKNTSPLQLLALEISRGLVAEMAPEEMEFFDELAQSYVSDPKRQHTKSIGQDDLLGFGEGELIAAITPAVLSAVSAVLSHIQTDLLKVASVETVSALKKKVSALFEKRHPTNTDPPPLTKVQLEIIRNLAQRQAQAFGLREDKAKLMAKALIGALALKL